MPTCPHCSAEFEEGADLCPGCGAEVSVLSDRGEDDDPVVVLHASTPNEALVAEATLESEGIPAFVATGDTVFPHAGNIDAESPDLDVVVPAELADRAAEVLSAPPLTDEELEAAAGVTDAEPA